MHGGESYASRRGSPSVLARARSNGRIEGVTSVVLCVSADDNPA
jgi:hypothetical protein